MTERLWRDLQRAMSPSEVQLFIDGWLKAKLDEDLEVRRLGDPEAVERHYAEQHEEFSGALWYKVKNDPTVAARHVDELLKALNIELDERDRDMANRFMIRAHLDLFKALVGRHDVRWRPWLDRDPAQALVDRLDRAPAPSPSPKHEPPAATFGKLSEVARQAIVDIGRLEDWRPKRRADYETAVETFIAAMARDPDMGEVSTEDAAGYMRDLTRYPSNATKRLSDWHGCPSTASRPALLLRRDVPPQ